jgi:hypothetical protein
MPVPHKPREANETIIVILIVTIRTAIGIRISMGIKTRIIIGGSRAISKVFCA